MYKKVKGDDTEMQKGQTSKLICRDTPFSVIHTRLFSYNYIKSVDPTHAFA